MANPLFSNRPQPGDQGIFALMKQLKSGNAQGIFDSMYRSNPQFRDFANSMRGKTPEQAFRERGFDFDQFRGFMR